jgi:hypothetical protein
VVVLVGNAGYNLFPSVVLRRGVAVAVECDRDSRIRGRIDLWVFVPLVIVRSIVFGSLLLRTFKIVFYTDMLLNWGEPIGGICACR